NGLSLVEIERLLDEVQRDDIDGTHGAFSVWSMDGPGDVLDLQRAVGSRFVNYNQLFAAPLPSIGAIRSELASMCLDLLGGGPDARATFTSGGSESIFVAMHAAREWARATKPHIERPEVVAPYSAHAAFTKACHYLGMRLRRVPLGPDFRADVG